MFRSAYTRGRVVVLAACAAVSLASGSASGFDDHQSWNSWTVSTNLTAKVVLTTESHFRFTDDASMLGQILLRPQVTYNAGPHHSYTAGYAYIRTRPVAGVVVNEHRTWEQIGYSGLTLGAWQLSGRTRIEQRFVEGGGGDTGWRLRQQLRAVVSMNDGGAVQGLLWNETFIGLNRTAWGQRANLDQSRTFAGVAWKIADNHTLEPGVLHQRVFRNGPDRDNIVISIGLVSRF